MKSPSLKILNTIIAVVVLTSTVLLCLARYWPERWLWLANATHYLPLLAMSLPIVILAVVSWFARMHRVSAVYLLSLYLIVVWIVGFHVRLPGARSINGQPVFQMRLMTINMQGMDFGDLLAYIDEQKPDVIVFQLESQEYRDKVLQSFSELRWHVKFSGQLGIISRYEILDAYLHYASQKWGGTLAKYELRGPAGDFPVVNVHLRSPRYAFDEVIRYRWGGRGSLQTMTRAQLRESRQFSTFIAKFEGAVLAGDFNLSQRNPIFQETWSQYRDAFQEGGFGFGFTKFTHWAGQRTDPSLTEFTQDYGWTKHIVGHSLRIDHILYDDDHWTLLNVEVGPDFGGDHRLVMADLAYTGAGLSSEKKTDAVGKVSHTADYEAVLIHEDFERTPGLFRAEQAAEVDMDLYTTYRSARSLIIRGAGGYQPGMAGIGFPNWNLDNFPRVRFAYRIPEGAPVNLRVMTHFNDWICIGGTTMDECPDSQSPVHVLLQNDGEWHEVEIDVREAVQSVLPVLKGIQRFQFYLPASEGQGGSRFWIDDFMIVR